MEKFSGAPMRELVASVAGPRNWSDTRESWLGRAARKAGISYRQVKAIWYGEITDPNHRSARLLRDAAAFNSLASVLRQTDAEFHSATIASYLEIAGALRSLEDQARAGQTNQENVEEAE